MNGIESIVQNLRRLPPEQQDQVGRYVEELLETPQEKRKRILGELFGSLSEEDGQAFEQALADSRRIEPV